MIIATSRNYSLIYMVILSWSKLTIHLPGAEEIRLGGKDDVMGS